MKVLTAAPPDRPDDLAALAGEIVRFALGCCDQGCGCNEQFVGLASNRYVSRAIVLDRPVTLNQLTQWCADNLAGWGLPDEAPAEFAGEIVDCAGSWPAGTVLRIDGVEVGPE